MMIKNNKLTSIIALVLLFATLSCSIAKSKSEYVKAKEVSNPEEVLLAVKEAKPGDIIWVKGGSYKFSQRIDIKVNGAQDARITLMANPNDKTRPNFEFATPEVNKYLSWGAGPRASQYLVIGAKCHAAISGKYAPDIEDVQAVALPILKHRVVRNYKAEAEGMSTEKILTDLF